jgi:hypothetical protein
MKFLESPIDLRPRVIPRMPKFGFRPEESAALARYFARLSGDRVGLRYEPDSRIPTTPYPSPATVQVKDSSGKVQYEATFRDAREETHGLFQYFNCNKCHLPLGSPGADPSDGGVSPSFEHSAQRLSRDWVRYFLNDPQHLQPGTAMTAFWPVSRSTKTPQPRETEREFLFDLRFDEAFLADLKGPTDGMSEEDRKAATAKRNAALYRLARKQMDHLADYVVFHYRPPAPPAEAPR